MIADLAIEYVPIDTVRTHPRNARRGAVEAIRDSIRTNGVYRPLIVQRSTGYVLAGNHTYKALVAEGATAVPVTYVDVDDDGAARIMVADNRTADLGDYDEKLLAEVLSSLPDLSGTGYDEGALADLLDAIMAPGEVRGDPDNAPDVPASPVSREGDLWLLGDHRVICGDSCRPETYRELLDGAVAEAMWTDPPYGVEYVGGTGDRLTIRNDGAEDARQVVEAFLPAARPFIRPGGAVYVCHAESQRSYLEGALATSGYLLRQALVWVKDRFVLGHSDYQNGHEPILSAEVPEKEFQHIAYGFAEGGSGRLGRGGPHWHGDNRSSTVFEVGKPKASALHPTMKPVELIRPMVRNSVARGALVLDPFGGSGSTMIAAHMEGRRAALVELDPRYVDVICRRFEEATGIVPVRASTGEPVSFVGGGHDSESDASPSARQA